ncbi:hypothetical protein C6P46_005958 [Rhodotorula mucilaginosa]|uniref:Uncharacterized protein n=1 Tax=Rhodotorula mucilaginosa TaxID=5537 RepID=A0A9P7B9P9_RHOMI|nr:hypothetical protein C6P46_005958 [Rhodotorula mucilaginosa]
MAVSCLLALYSPLARWTNALCVPPSPRRAAPSTDVRLLGPSLPPDRAVAMPWLEPSRGGPNSLKMRDKEAREGPAMHTPPQSTRIRCVVVSDENQSDPAVPYPATHAHPSTSPHVAVEPAHVARFRTAARRHRTYPLRYRSAQEQARVLPAAPPGSPVAQPGSFPAFRRCGWVRLRGRLKPTPALGRNSQDARVASPQPGPTTPRKQAPAAARVRDEFPLPSFGWTRVCIAASAPRPSSGTCLSFAVRRPCQGDAPIGPPRGDINLLPKPDPLPGATPPLARSETAHSPDVPAFIATSTLATSSLRLLISVALRASEALEPVSMRLFALNPLGQ